MLKKDFGGKIDVLVEDISLVVEFFFEIGEEYADFFVFLILKDSKIDEICVLRKLFF